jgi:hypothetical protein
LGGGGEEWVMRSHGATDRLTASGNSVELWAGLGEVVQLDDVS